MKKIKKKYQTDGTIVLMCMTCAGTHTHTHVHDQTSGCIQVLCNQCLQLCKSKHYNAPYTTNLPYYSNLSQFGLLLNQLPAALLQSHAPQAQSSSTQPNPTFPYHILPHPSLHHPNPIQPMGCAQYSTSEKFIICKVIPTAVG